MGHDARRDRIRQAVRAAARRWWPEGHRAEAAVLDAAELALAMQRNTDAAYHDAGHTELVTLTGLDLLDGLAATTGAPPDPRAWSHALIAMLFHDVGYVRGACADDAAPRFVTTAAGQPPALTALPEGATDAALMRWHVDRGMRLVHERLDAPELDPAWIADLIDATRFPVPAAEALRAPSPETDLRALVRAADLIGQLSDPAYLARIPALFAEMVEGAPHGAPFVDPDEMRAGYPAFYAREVHPWIADALPLLDATASGRARHAELRRQLALARPEPTLPDQAG
jgi:hypothetical protein